MTSARDWDKTTDNLNLIAQWTPHSYLVEVTTYHISNWLTNSVYYSGGSVPSSETWTFEEHRSWSFSAPDPNNPFVQVPTSLIGVFSAVHLSYANGDWNNVKQVDNILETFQ